MLEQIKTVLCLNAVPIAVLSVSILCDIMTGLIKAILSHDLQSSKFKDGLLKKTLDYILVVIGTSLDVLFECDYISSACLYCLIAMEFYSCVENLRDYIPVPKVITNVLETLQKRGE